MHRLSGCTDIGFILVLLFELRLQPSRLGFVRRQARLTVSLP